MTPGGDDDSTSGNLSESNLENHPRHLGPSSSPWMRMRMRFVKLDTSCDPAQMTVNQSQRSSWARCSQQEPWWRTPPCEIIQQQSQRYSHQSNGGPEPMVQTIRKQPKACKKIQIEKSSGFTINVDSPLLAWLPRHAAWKYT